MPIYQWNYTTPDGCDNMIMNSDGEFLTALCFENSRDGRKTAENCKKKILPVFEETAAWLDVYFEGKEPDFMPKYKLHGLTPFREQVSEIMKKIPYGETITYNDIARQIAKSRNIAKMSAHAVGGAVGWNPICIIIPCHRVVGAAGSLTGYGGGIKNKIYLLKTEGIDVSRFTVPSKRI